MKSRETTTTSLPLVDVVILVVGIIFLALDQLSKGLVIGELGPGAARHSVEVLGDFVRFSFTTNTGAAFGMLPERTIIFTVISCAAVPLFLFAHRFVDARSLFVRLTLGLLLGGTLGNLVDRIRLGRVTDFIDVGIGSARFWVFNVADSAFVVGVALLAIYMLFLAPPDDAEAPAAPTVGERKA